MKADRVYLNIRPTPTGNAALVVFGLISFLLILIAFSKITGSYFDKRDWTIQCSVVLSGWLFFYLVATRLYFKTFYLYTTIFLFCLLLFHYGLIFQHAIGVLEGNIWPEKLLPWVNKAAWATSLACGSLGLGMSAMSIVAGQRMVTPKVARIRFDRLNQFASTYYIGLFAASACLISFAVVLSGNILNFSRFELFFGNHPGLRFIGVFTMVFPTAISLFALTPRSKLKRKGALIVALFCTMLLLLTGYRSIALFPLFVGAVSWVKMGNRIPSLIAVVMIFLTLLSISVVGYLRHQGSYGSFNQSTISDSLEKADVSQSLSSMGQSVGVLAHTMRLIPEQEGYRWGRTYWLYIKKALPNFGSELDDSDYRIAIYKRIMEDKSALQDLIPSDWATYWILPTQFKTGGGVGFSAVGEPYMNFGFVGIVLYFFLLGMFLCNFDRKVLRYNPRWFVFASCFYWYFVVTVRNDFGNFIKPTVFLLLIMFFWSFALRFIPVKTK